MKRHASRRSDIRYVGIVFLLGLLMVDVARTGVFFHVRFNGKMHAFVVTSGPRRAIEVSSTMITTLPPTYDTVP
jgi:hypothetical protein